VARLSGGEIALLRVLPALRQDVDVHVILGEDGPLADRLRSAEISVEVLPISSRLRDLRKGTINPLGVDLRAIADALQHVARLSRRLREIGPDVVHTNSLKAAFYGGAAARLARLSVVWHIRDRIAADYLPKSAVLLVRLASRVLPGAVVTESQSTRRALTQPPGIRAAHVFVVPNAVEPAVLPERIAHDHTTVGIVGRLARWKGQHVFLEAFALAFSGTEARARVIGSAMFGEEAYERSLRDRVDELQIANQVDFRGFRDPIWRELAELDILVHCSLTPEPFGQVVLEGMAAGLAVVASREGGPAEMITDGVDGLLTRPGDVQELSDALVMLSQSADERRRLGCAARTRSLDFTPARAATQLLSVYKAVLNGRAR
jgi:glycosyltransferase involved in cell wall biosynthesis